MEENFLKRWIDLWHSAVMVSQMHTYQAVLYVSHISIKYLLKRKKKLIDMEKNKTENTQTLFLFL